MLIGRIDAFEIVTKNMVTREVKQRDHATQRR